MPAHFNLTKKSGAYLLNYECAKHLPNVEMPISKVDQSKIFGHTKSRYSSKVVTVCGHFNNKIIINFQFDQKHNVDIS